MLRTAALVVVWTMVVLGLAGLALRWVDADGYLPILQSALPVFGVPVVLALVASLALRDRPAVLGASLATALVIVLAAPTLIPHRVSARDGDEVVMTANMEFGRGSVPTIMRAVRDHHVDTIVLVEVTPGALRHLDADGLARLMPHRVGATRTDFRGTVIASAHPLRAEPASVPDGGALMPAALVSTAHGDYRLRGVHTYAPLPNIAAQWRRGLEELRRWQRAQPRDTPVVLAGDFNSGFAMPAFRHLASGLTDSARESGRGLVRTWPHGRRYPPFTALDHVLTRDARVVSTGEVSVPNTDHRAIWARLRMG